MRENNVKEQPEWEFLISLMALQQEYFSFFLFPSSVFPLAPSLSSFLFRHTHSVANLSPKPQPWEIPNGFCQQGQPPPQPCSRHTRWAQTQAWGQWREWECATHRAGGYNFSFYLAPLTVRGRKTDEASRPLSALDELFSLSFSSGWEAGEWQWLAYCQLGSTSAISAQWKTPSHAGADSRL